MEENNKILFSIIVVCLNPKDKLRQTLNSIKEQEYNNYEVIIKDGLSEDDSLSIIDEFKSLPIKLYSEKDCGIYDAMNQGLGYADGEFIYYLNCGDTFSSSQVLSQVAAIILDSKSGTENNDVIFYGNIFEQTTKATISSNPQIDGFACYRNLPCHQACFYSRRLIIKHGFNINYKVRADYEQFLWCYYIAKAKMNYMDITIASYEGNGYSESENGLRISKLEHKEITAKYMTKREIFKYRMLLALTLAPLRTKIAQNKNTAKLYNRIKDLIYRRTA